MRLLIVAILVCAGGSFHYGIQLTILNPTEYVFRQFINESHFQHYGRYLTEDAYRVVWSIILNLQLLGSLIGTLPVVKLSEKLGRRRALYASAGATMAGLILQTLSKFCTSYELLAVGRCLTGIGSGLALPLEGMYLNEVSPLKKRGLFGSMTGIFVELGFIVGGVIALPALLGTSEMWPWMFIVETAPCIILILTLPLLHESPKYLLARQNTEKCRRSLQFFHHKDIDASIEEIESEIHSQQKQMKWSELWRKIHLRRAVFLSSLVILAASFSGIVVIDYFSTNILMDVGLSRSMAQYASVGIFAQSFLSAIVGSFCVERLGRRLLLLSTTLSLILMNAALMAFTLVYDKYGVAWAGYTSIAACVALTFAFGLGPAVLQWIVTSEMVPQNIRSKVQLVVMLVQKISAAIVGLAFFPLQGLIGPMVFLLFIVPLGIFFVIFLLKFPETKRKTVTDIMRELGYEGEEDERNNNVMKF